MSASNWWENRISIPEAIRYAFAAKDYDKIANLAELTWKDMDNSFQSATWLSWVQKLPEDLFRERPVLSTQYAWALWFEGDLSASEERLRDAELWLIPHEDKDGFPKQSKQDMVVVDEQMFKSLPAKIAVARTYIAQSRGDVAGAVKYAELAYSLTNEEDFFGKAQAIVSLGFTYWMNGKLEEACSAMLDWITTMEQLGNIPFSIASTFALADMMIAQGRLRDAVSAYQQSLQLVSEQDPHVKQIIAHNYLGLAMLHHEMANQDAFNHYLKKSEEAGEISILLDWSYRWVRSQAQLEESQGNFEVALDLLEQAKYLHVKTSTPDIYPLEAVKVRIFVRQGKLALARAWMKDRNVSPNDDLSYLQEFEHMIVARVLIAEYEKIQDEASIQQASRLLDRLLLAAEEGKRMHSVIQILILQAFTYQAQGNTSNALIPLRRALRLAEPEGYARIFIDEGLPMEALLNREMKENQVTKEFTQKLLAVYGTKRTTLSKANQPLVDPLSERELEVLALIAQGRTNQEIGDRLYLSLNTVKVHTRNIYSKMGVNNRTQAVAQARTIGLLIMD
jgi:LuxR family maltose regulon positive regulatory protein